MKTPKHLHISFDTCIPDCSFSNFLWSFFYKASHREWSFVQINILTVLTVWKLLSRMLISGNMRRDNFLNASYLILVQT